LRVPVLLPRITLGVPVRLDEFHPSPLGRCIQGGVAWMHASLQFIDEVVADGGVASPLGIRVRFVEPPDLCNAAR
jgi:hypothetical protein